MPDHLLLLTTAAPVEPVQCTAHIHTPGKGRCRSAHAMIHGGIQPHTVVAYLTAKTDAIWQLTEANAAPLQFMTCPGEAAGQFVQNSRRCGGQSVPHAAHRL